MSHIAKLFKNGSSQAVRLPAEYRFASTEVYIRRDPETGNVILSRKPTTWDGFLAALKVANKLSCTFIVEVRANDLLDPSAGTGTLPQEWNPPTAGRRSSPPARPWRTDPAPAILYRITV
ncbi:MAG: AbrB/MazE/SpoVT family DNA-binding domain-containing protein [Candidatus Accumulibacter sp.]|uniref:AbrB/MazE/SpoVT family DNA-binding domain-containing protein n=1 Tax=Candidatus Accumulibacter proximus TaxID=2954385 RepID=A0A935PXY9_9PROT|nr:AbrB/MazE/SpoVT family DNA-binding domain-containing protein [Candidatus Accumulibacter proximus]